MSEINVDLAEENIAQPASPPKRGKRKGETAQADRRPVKLSPEEEAAFLRAKSLGQRADEVAGFKVPTDFVQLPSGGKVYPIESNLYNVKEVELRHLTAADEDILTSRSLLRSGKAIDTVIGACLADKSIVVEDLLSGDKNAIITFLRVSGYGAGYEVEMDCPSCGETSKHEFDLSNLQMKTLDIEPVADGDNRFNFQLPQSKINIEFRFLNSLQDKEITDAQEKLKKRTQSPIDRNVTTRLKNVIISIEGNSDQSYINKFVDTMNVRDSRAIRKYIEDNTPDLDMESDFECVHCGHRGEVEIPITVGFFWPDT
jgi:hypothetical protein